eukprot:301664-Pyramimonas_sp.AAC.1
MVQANGGAQFLHLFEGSSPFMGMAKTTVNGHNVLQHSVVTHRNLPVSTQPAFPGQGPEGVADQQRWLD